MTRFYSIENISSNQRAWYRQKHNPSLCKYCNEKVVFMKDLGGRYVVCLAVKKIVSPGEGDTKIMQEDGLISKEGRRVGWPVHDCPKAPIVRLQNQLGAGR